MSTSYQPSSEGIPRRRLLTHGGLLGAGLVAAPVLAACTDEPALTDEADQDDAAEGPASARFLSSGDPCWRSRPPVTA
jgi:hypothetical protein